MKPEKKHTRTPWKIQYQNGQTNRYCPGEFAIGNGHREENIVAHAKKETNAAFIVHAVNLHADLIAALENLVNQSAELSPFAGNVSVRSVRQAGKFMDAVSQARAALANAKRIPEHKAGEGV